MRRVASLLLVASLIGCQNPEEVNPVIYTEETQEIGQTSATLVGRLQDPGVTAVWTYGFVWSESPNPNVVTGNLIVLGERDVAGTFSANEQNLLPSTTYYVRAFVSDAEFSTIFYASPRDFNTLP